MPQSYTIAIVEDDVPVGNMLEEQLGRQGYRVVRAYSGTEALLLFEKEKPDLILLDLMLPGLSGEEILPKIRDIPVIVTSAKVDIDSKVKLLMEGASDYVSKPFDTQELLARIAVQLRGRKTGEKRLLSAGNVTLDVSARTVEVAGEPVRLTRTEYAILKVLLMHGGEVVSRYRILDDIFTDTPDCTEDSLKTHMSNLRRKLARAGADCSIEAVWGIGFRILTNS